MAYTKRRTSHKKELYYILCILAVVSILSYSLFGPGGYRDLRKSRIELQAQRARVDLLQKQNRERMRTIERLIGDPNALEEYAREKGYGRPDEIIQQLPKDPDESK